MGGLGPSTGQPGRLADGEHSFPAIACRRNGVSQGVSSNHQGPFSPGSRANSAASDCGRSAAQWPMAGCGGRRRRVFRMSPPGRIANQTKRPADHSQQRSDERESHIPAEPLPGIRRLCVRRWAFEPTDGGALPPGRVRLGALQIGAAGGEPGFAGGDGGNHLGQFLRVGKFGHGLGHLRRNRITFARILGQHRLVDLFQVLRAVGATVRAARGSAPRRGP